MSVPEFLKSEPAVIIGTIVAALNALIVVIGAGDFDDGLQWADLVPILAPILGALGIRTSVWSQRSVDRIAPREAQEQALGDPNRQLDRRHR